MRVAVEYRRGSQRGIPHWSQIYTGLILLDRRRTISLRWVERRRNSHALRAEADGTRICFDMTDGPHLDQAALAEVEHYFKRSYDVSMAAVDGGKVHPIGLNYEVHAGLYARLRGWPTTRTIAASPRDCRWDGPQVLFLTRLWSDAQTGDRCWEALNEFRIATVRALERELGHRFIGGIQDSPQARLQCPDLIADPSITHKRRYLALVRKVPICIATTGLHGSIGWKFGEYVAMSRAIVTEPIRHVVPGEFAEGDNYLTFTSEEQCLEAVAGLLSDRQRCEDMMWANHRYHQEHGTPDAMVKYALSFLR